MGLTSREWLERLSTSADVHEGMPADRMRDALLAVLDFVEFDLDDPLLSVYYERYRNTMYKEGIKYSQSWVRSAINKALGIDDV